MEADRPEVAERRPGRVLRGALMLASSLVVGGYLLLNGWVFIGGLAVLFGVFGLSSAIRPQWVADGVLAFFWTFWSGLGLYVLLRDGRFFAAVPVFFLFLGGLNRARGLFAKGKEKPLPAAERVIEGVVKKPDAEPSRDGTS